MDDLTRWAFFVRMPQVVGLDEDGAGLPMTVDNDLDVRPFQLHYKRDFFGSLAGTQMPDDGGHYLFCLLSHLVPPPGPTVQMIPAISTISKSTAT